MELFQEAALSAPVAPQLTAISGIHNEFLNMGEESNILDNLYSDDIELNYEEPTMLLPQGYPIYHFTKGFRCVQMTGHLLKSANVRNALGADLEKRGFSI